jgi:hypothetical protein
LNCEPSADKGTELIDVAGGALEMVHHDQDLHKCQGGMMMVRKNASTHQKGSSSAMSNTTIHLTEEVPSRTLLSAAKVSRVSIRVVRGYGLELALFESMLAAALARVTYRDLNPRKEVAFGRPMSQLAYTLRRRPDVNEPFDVEVTYQEVDVAG